MAITDPLPSPEDRRRRLVQKLYQGMGSNKPASAVQRAGGRGIRMVGGLQGGGSQRAIHNLVQSLAGYGGGPSVSLFGENNPTQAPPQAPDQGPVGPPQDMAVPAQPPMPQPTFSAPQSPMNQPVFNTPGGLNPGLSPTMQSSYDPSTNTVSNPQDYLVGTPMNPSYDPTNALSLLLRHYNAGRDFF